MHMPWDIYMDVYQNEEELLEGLRRNDEMACTCLLKRFAHRLSLLARRLVNSDIEAEEVLQESFIQACSHIARFEGKSSLHTWLYRIVTNAALMKRRRHMPEALPLPTERFDEHNDYGMTLIDEENTPDAKILHTEVCIAIRDALSQLPDALREAFILRHIDGLSTKAAAKQLEITESALKVRLYRARKMLQILLAAYQ